MTNQDLIDRFYEDIHSWCPYDKGTNGAILWSLPESHRDRIIELVIEYKGRSYLRQEAKYSAKRMLGNRHDTFPWISTREGRQYWLEFYNETFNDDYDSRAGIRLVR